MWGEKRALRKAVKAETRRVGPIVEQASDQVSEGLAEIEQRLNSLGKPRCPDCAAVMVIRRARRSFNEFWGCPTYPRCHGYRSRKSWERFEIERP